MGLVSYSPSSSATCPRRAARSVSCLHSHHSLVCHRSLTTRAAYHIHVNPVPGDGNCTNTLAHLDPYIRGEDPVCNANLSQTCQVGDLSGKHGKITSDPFEARYTEWYASTVDGIGAFFGNRSLVVHFGNKTRITCANFVKVADSYPQGPVPDSSTAGCSNITGVATATTQAPSSSGTGKVPTGPASTPARVTPTPSVVTVSAATSMRFVSGAAGALAFAVAIMFAL